MDLNAIQRARNKVMQREELLIEAVREYDQVTTQQLELAQVQAKSRPLKVTEVADLLDMSRTHVYRVGAHDCQTYLELYTWVKQNRPAQIKSLESNYSSMVR